ncbi:MAG TPA: glycosyltransferase family 4 protein [Methanocella sp.]|nr:glycosyltransferase family 4 protein [Methanocella sp.]
MDVAFITTRLVDRDAQGNFSEATLAGLKERCSRVVLYTFAFERRPQDGIEIRYIGGENRHSTISNVKALLRTGRLARELASFDLLVLAGPDIGILPAIHRAKRFNRNIRIFWVYHSLTPPEFLPSLKDRLLARIRKLVYIASMKRSDGIQTFSRFVKGELVDAGIDADKIFPMPFAIDTKRFSTGNGSASVRDHYGLQHSFVMLYVGRLAPAKRIDLLINVLQMFEGGVALLIVGGGPEKEKLEKLAKDSGGNVIFAGRVPDEELQSYYAACDVWITASEHEGFCVPIVEAMAAGRPVIVPDVAAMPETAGDAGLTYPAGNLAAMAAAIRRLKDDRESYNRLSATARNTAGNFEIREKMGKYLDMLLASGVNCLLK